MIRELLRGSSAALVGLAFAFAFAARAEPPAPPAKPSAYVPVWTRKLEPGSSLRTAVSIEDGGYALLTDERDFLPVLRRFDAAGVELWKLPLAELACRDGRPHVYELQYTRKVGFTLVGSVERGTSISYEGVNDVWV